MTKYIVKNCPSLDDVLDVDTSKIVYKNYCLNKKLPLRRLHRLPDKAGGEDV